MRGGSVVVRYDGAQVLSGSVAPIPSGIFGIAAGTGGEAGDAVEVRNFHGKFYDCPNPRQP